MLTSKRLALRYLGSKKHPTGLRTTIILSFASLFVGTFALALTLSISQGFETTIKRKVRGVNPEVIISAPHGMVDGYKLSQHLLENYPTLIKSASPQSSGYALIEQNGAYHVVLIKGIDPHGEVTVTNLRSYITLPPIPTKNTFAQLIKDDQVIIGSKLAARLNLAQNQTINLSLAHEGKTHLFKAQVKVGGIFKVGFEEYDQSIIFCSLERFNHLFKRKPHTHDQVAVSLRGDQFCLNSLFKISSNKVAELKQKLGGVVTQSWEEIYPALFSSLELEKYLMGSVVSLITLVALISCAALIFMLIQRRQKEIALLQALSVPQKKIRAIFVQVGLLLVSSAALAGSTSAALVAHLLETKRLIRLPDVYYSSHLPADLSPEIFIGVFLLITLLGAAVVFMATHSLKKGNLVQILKHE